jgi:nickel transport protein
MKKLIGILCLWATFAQAHEVHHRIEATDAVVITLTYANGQPFAYEKYALTPAGQETPQQVGNTDAQGRIAFVPGATQAWRLQATSADGHGINQEFTVPATGSRATSANEANETTPRWLLAGFGLSLIFGLFGLFQLFMRKKP